MGDRVVTDGARARSFIDNSFDQIAHLDKTTLYLSVVTKHIGLNFLCIFYNKKRWIIGGYLQHTYVTHLPARFRVERRIV